MLGYGIPLTKHHNCTDSSMSCELFGADELYIIGSRKSVIV